MKTKSIKQTRSTGEHDANFAVCAQKNAVKKDAPWIGIGS